MAKEKEKKVEKKIKLPWWVIFVGLPKI